MSVWYYIALSCYGKFVLDIRPKRQSIAVVVGMLFSAGIGIGLRYWSTAEPLYHFIPCHCTVANRASSKRCNDPLILYWRLHAWGLYAVVVLSLSYFYYRCGLTLIHSLLVIFHHGKKIYGKWGRIVNTLAVFGTVFGIGNLKLGLGVIQLKTGLVQLLASLQVQKHKSHPSPLLPLCATISVMAGLVKRVIKWLMSCQQNRLPNLPKKKAKMTSNCNLKGYNFC